MEKKLNDLLWLNELLIQFGEETHSSKTQALKVLKTKVFINIYDLATDQYKKEQYEKRTTKNLLRKELKEHPERRYPLHSTKKNIILKTFLIKL